jgi:hypothetical protein
VEIKQSLRINVFSIQHQNYNGRWLTLFETLAQNLHPERPDKIWERRTFTIFLQRRQRHFQGVLEPG